MNEHIRELMKQAGITFTNYGSGKFLDAGDIDLSRLEKFTELIIEECAFQCQHLGDMERIGKHFEVDVFKQFGV